MGSEGTRFVGAVVAMAFVLAAAGVLAFTTRHSGGDATTTSVSPEFVVECTWSHRAADDPIVHPGHPGAAHMHDFFGSTSTDATTTAADLLGSQTSCQTLADTAAYWAPTLYLGSEAIDPSRLFAYYRRPPAIDRTSIQPYPLGLAVVADDVAWHCGASDDLASEPISCSRTAPLTLRVAFPACWNGRDLDSTDHHSHVSYGTDAGCPSSHPVGLPELVLDISYAFAGEPSGLRLSSGAVSTAHADFLNAWDPAQLADRVESCLQQGARCGPPPLRAVD